MSNPEPVRVGIIGTGRIAVDSHVPHLRIAGGAVTALADVAPGRAARFAGELAIAHGFDGYRDLLNCDEVDAVAICTPPNVRAEIATAALKAGKHVYLEKPPALTAGELRPLVRLARDLNLRFLAGSHQVYEPEVQAARKLVSEGALGTVYYAEALKLIRRGIPRGWHRRREIAGGGVTYDSTPHRLDLALFLLGEPTVQSVTARTYSHFADLSVSDDQPGYKLMDVAEGVADPPEPSDVEDTVAAMIQLVSGATFMIRDARIAHMRPNWEFKLLGTAGGIELSPTYAGAKDRPLLQFFSSDAQGGPADRTIDVAPNTRGTHVPIYEHFFQCIRDGAETSSNGDRAVQVMEILEAIHRSASSGGRQVRLER